MNDKHDLSLLLNSTSPLICIESREEQRALNLLRSVATMVDRSFYQWKITEGLQSLRFEIEKDAESVEPGKVLLEIKSEPLAAIYILIDFHPYLDDPVHVRLIKDIAIQFESKRKTIIFLSHKISLPEELRALAMEFSLALPDAGQVKKLVKDEALKWANENKGKKVKTSRTHLDALVQNLMGLPYSDVKRLARNAIVDDGVINENDLPGVMQAKYDLLNQDSILHFEYDTEQFSQVGGFDHLKEWLAHRKNVFTDKQGAHGHKLDQPKGVLLLGVQGCGKSLAAKAIAGIWQLPLLRFDIGALYNKFHGETEKNLREALASAEVLSPCVLWIDEIEKGLSVSESDSATSRRVLGTFLSWLAEHDSAVFVVATANDIQALPPELIRKGRFDEIFFVDLPEQETRKNIFSIHLRKRDYQPGEYDLDTLAEQTKGFSGAEIEQVIVAAVYRAVAANTSLTDKDIFTSIQATRPLSIIMDSEIAALRQWAETRTVKAN